MATRLEKHQARLDAVNALGRALVRRARSRCELCEVQNTPLHPHEVPPTDEEPELERTLFVCQRCGELIDGKATIDNADDLRWLMTSVWSELLVVQVASVRILDQLVDRNVRWAAETRESLYLSEEAQAWLELES